MENYRLNRTRKIKILLKFFEGDTTPLSRIKPIEAKPRDLSHLTNEELEAMLEDGGGDSKFASFTTTQLIQMLGTDTYRLQRH
jgi:hypothetical protein